MKNLEAINDTAFVTTKDFEDNVIWQSETFTIDSEEQMESLLNDKLKSKDTCKSVEVEMKFKYENEEQKEQIENDYGFSSCYQVDVDEDEKTIEFMYSIYFEESNED
jgi:hypothetical protein